MSGRLSSVISPIITTLIDVRIRQHLERRRDEAVKHWALRDEIVLVGAGEPVPMPGRGDRTYPFRSHSEYFYLSDRDRPSGALAFDPDDGWFDFVAPVSESELLWSGADGADQEVPEGAISIAELEGWLQPRRGRRMACLGVALPDVKSDHALVEHARSALNHVRRPKDELELERMRAAEKATSAGFAAMASLLSTGRTEREIQIELEAEFFRHGGDFLAFDTIVAGGPNSAVLHFAPTSRMFEDGDLVLIDAGAEYRSYASDITRTYSASGRFTPEQAQLHSLVRTAEARGIERCEPGTEWRDVHKSAAVVIADGLIDFGLLRGRPDSLLERGTVSLFFPHGVGHMVGLGVRDAGEVLPGRTGQEGGFPSLRVDLPLERGHVVTVEPGIYFVPAILDDPDRRRQHRDAVNWELVERMIGFGGIRIEDNVLVTDDAPEVLSADIPIPGS